MQRMFPDKPLGQPVKRFEDTFSGESVVMGMFFQKRCMYCDLNHNRIKMRRQIIHYVGRRVIVCTKD